MGNKLVRIIRGNYEYFLIPVGLAAFLGIWQVIAGFYETFILPSPAEVWDRLLEFFRQGLVLGHFWATFSEAMAGFLGGTLIALPLGYYLARHSWIVSVLPLILSAFRLSPLLPWLLYW
jgi:NitT/TauT family transport system permease protein